MNRYGKYKPPGVKLGVPFPEKKASETPGPAHYCPKWPVDNRGFQMGKLSERPPKPPVGPAPNAYHLPSTLYSRPMVMGGRPREAATWSSPEPGKYDIPPLATKRGISFGKRIEVKSNNPTPGPADYYVTDVCCKSGTKDAKFTTFGSRRPVVTGFAVPGDNDTYWTPGLSRDVEIIFESLKFLIQVLIIWLFLKIFAPRVKKIRLWFFEFRFKKNNIWRKSVYDLYETFFFLENFFEKKKFSEKIKYKIFNYNFFKGYTYTYAKYYIFHLNPLSEPIF